MKRIYYQISKHRRIIPYLIILLDIGFFSLFNPFKVGLALLVAAFLLILMSIYISSRFVFFVLDRLGYLRKGHKWLTEGAALLIFIMIMMQSAGQLSVRDIVALLPLTWLAYFYFSRSSSGNKTDS